MKTSTRSLKDIFSEIDTDGNGWISQVEFRNAIRRLNLGLTSKQIDQLIARLDVNGDGKIDYDEFCAKFAPKELDTIMLKRAANKLARLKELLIMHMTSCNDAFRHVS